MQDEVIIDHGEHPAGHEGHAQDDSRYHRRDGSKETKQAAAGKPLPPLQTVVQLNIYRDTDGHFEYLLLRRIDEDEQFWQVVTEPVGNTDTIADSLRGAVGEQTGIHGFRHLSHETYSYEWYAGSQRGRDIVFAAEVSPLAAVKLDEGRYNAYAWLPAAEAIQRLKWNGNKQALRQLDEHLHQKRRETPATEISKADSTGTAAGDAAAQAQATDADSHNPYGDNVPKRLPDRPEDGITELKPYPIEEEDRTGEWFL